MSTLNDGHTFIDAFFAGRLFPAPLMTEIAMDRHRILRPLGYGTVMNRCPHPPRTCQDCGESSHPDLPEGIKPLRQARTLIDLDTSPSPIKESFLHRPRIVPLGRALVRMS